MTLPPTPTADKAYKIIGVFLILVGISSLAISTYDVFQYVRTHTDPETSFVETVLSALPVVYVGWSPWLMVAVMAIGIGLRMLTVLSPRNTDDRRDDPS